MSNSTFTVGLASLALATAMACPTAARDCPADLDLTGAVDAGDITQLIQSWGENGGVADLTLDGIVDGADLGELLLAWGPCSGVCPTEYTWQPGLGSYATYQAPWGFGVYALRVYDDGVEPTLYVGGRFNKAGDIVANGIARWNGTTWSAMGDGFDGPVHAIEVFDDGAGPSIYAAGNFTTADGQPARSIARWTGSTWVPLGEGFNGWVRTLEVFDDGTGPALYVGGSFDSADGIPAGMIRRWRRNTWATVADDLAGDLSYSGVYDLHTHDDGRGDGPTLYAAGYFTAAGDTAVANVAQLTQGAWQQVGSGLPGGVWGLTSVEQPEGSMLVAGGGFVSPYCNLVSWDGSKWTVVGGCFGREGHYCEDVCEVVYSNSCWSITSVYSPMSSLFPSFVIGGGQCGAVGWTEDGFEDLSGGLGINPTPSSYPPYPLVFAWTEFDDGTGTKLIAGGPFNIAGGMPVRGLAAWDGASWVDVGGGVGPPDLYMGGLNQTVHALAATTDGLRTSLVVAGSFSIAGTVEARRIARLEQDAWAPLGAGMNGTVLALASFYDGTTSALFAGGDFTVAGEVDSNRVALWDGESWSPLGRGMNGTVNSLAIFDDGTGHALYAGGSFTTADETAAIGVARWNGQSWSPLGTGLNGSVSSLVVFDDGTGSALYAGGSFTTAGGTESRRIARWNGEAWSPLGLGMNDVVLDLATLDDGTGPALFAAGKFTTAGEIEATRIARWNGDSWSNLGAGLNDTVHALIAFDDGTGPALYAGGRFTAAGEVELSRLGRWDGKEWTGLGLGISRGAVSSFAVVDETAGPVLYVGGLFSAAGGILSRHIAKWACSPTGSYAWQQAEGPNTPEAGAIRVDVASLPVPRALDDASLEVVDDPGWTWPQPRK